MKLLKGTLLGGAFLFAWSAVSWMVLPWHNAGFNAFTPEEPVLAAIDAAAPQSGVYLAPSPKPDGAPAPGPFAHVIVKKAGYGSLGRAMGLGFLGNLLSAFLATLLLLQLGPRSLVEKVLFLLTAAVLAWSGRYLADVAYWGLPWRNALVDLADLLIAWTLAGSALAWLTRPRAE
jgi:hypothetical protein